MCVEHLLRLWRDDSDTFSKPVVHTSLYCAIVYTAYVLVWKAVDPADVDLSRMPLDLWFMSCHVAALFMTGRLHHLAENKIPLQKTAGMLLAFALCAVASHMGGAQVGTIAMLCGSLVCSVAFIYDHGTRSSRITALQIVGTAFLYIPAFAVAASEPRPSGSMFPVAWLSMLLRYTEDSTEISDVGEAALLGAVIQGVGRFGAAAL